MKKLFTISILFLLFGGYLFGAVITGNQNKVSVIGGSIDVSAGGASVTVNSGEMATYGEGNPPSQPKKIEKGDMNDVYSELTPSSDENTIHLVLELITNPTVAQKIRLEMIQKGLPRDKIELKRMSKGTQIVVRSIPLEEIKLIYSGHYKAGITFFKADANKGKTPTITIKPEDIKKYHATIFRKYN